MRIDWNTQRTKEHLSIPESYLAKDAVTQNRRELTFLLQEAAFAQRIPIYCVIDVDLLAEEEKQLFACDEFTSHAAILLGLPIQEMLLFMEQTVPELNGSRIDSMAQLRVKTYLLDYADKLEQQGYQTRKIFPDVLPDHTYARMLALSKKGFVGKNGRFVTEDYSSKMCIGILLTDAPLMGGDYRYPDYLGNGCGDCRACIDACPAGALAEDGFDRSKCVAYRNEPGNQLQIAKHSVMKCMKCMEVCLRGK